ncbi:Mediator complex, subunit Med17 [Pseudohyphozyma bogoriensis]|nr:Mediator complex, subunit Med17 [Pseudohyphozyma bogoriensis]
MQDTPAKRLCLSLEPPPPKAHDSLDNDPFVRPAQLYDINLDDGSDVFTRDGPQKPVGERLKRLWAERGDFSALTARSILAPKADDVEVDKDEDTRPTPQEVREFQASLMQQLEVARGELTTALDLLSVISAPTDPPSVDLESLPLPQEALSITPTRPPAPLATDLSENPLAALPLATSLASLKSSANAFLHASEALDPAAADAPSTVAPTPRAPTTTPDPWPTLLNLASTSAYPLLPLGAGRGATLTGKLSDRAARQVGVFYGCTEAREAFRRGAVASMSSLMDKDRGKGGRTLRVELEIEGRKEESAWVVEQEEDGIETTLKARGRSAFSEELFSVLSNEARTDTSLKAQLVLGKQSEGDAILMEGHGWVLRIRMVNLNASKPAALTTPSSSGQRSSTIIALLRLLFLQEYALRRAPPATLLWTRPILSTLSVLLSHTYRRLILQKTLKKIAASEDDSIPSAELEFWGSGMRSQPGADDREELGESVLRILKGDKELGGLAVLRVTPTRVFHVTFSLTLPQAPSMTSHLPPTFTHQTITMQSPGSAPVSIPSLSHLEAFLGEQVTALRREMSMAEKAKKTMKS